MKMRLFYVVALLMGVYSLHTNGQTLSFQWSRQFDAYGLKNVTKAVAADKNGNVYTAGWSQHGSASDEDYVISKYNSAGTRKWTTTWNPGTIDEPASIAVSGGWVYVTGKTKQGSYYTIGTTKLDTTSGNLPQGQGWPEIYPATANVVGTVVKIGQAGDVFVAGTVYNAASPYADYIVLKYPSAGGSTYTQYTRDVSLAGSLDTLVDMALGANDSVYITGSTTTAGNENYCTIKLTNGLAEKWLRQYDYTGVSNGYDCPSRVLVDRSLNVIVTGVSYAGGPWYPDDDIVTIKYNTGGTQLYAARQTENVYWSWESAADMALDSNNNIYITGSVGYFRGGPGGLITMKYDTTLTQKWYTRSLGALSSPALARNIAVDAGGNNTYSVAQIFCFVAPIWTTNKDIFITHYDATGHVLDGIRFDGSFGDGGVYGPKDSATSIATDGSNGDIFVGGTTTSTLDTNQGLYGIVLKVSAGTAFRSSAAFLSVGPQNTLVVPGNYKLSQNYPNPFNPSTKISFTLPSASSISLKVYDITGREVESLANNEYFSAGTHEIRFEGSNHASGVYFYRLFSADGKFNMVKKMVLMK